MTKKTEIFKFHCHTHRVDEARAIVEGIDDIQLFPGQTTVTPRSIDRRGIETNYLPHVSLAGIGKFDPQTREQLVRELNQNYVAGFDKLTQVIFMDAEE